MCCDWRKSMTSTLRVLVIEDSEVDFELLIWELRRSEYELITERVETPEDMEAALADRSWDIVLSDWSLPIVCSLAVLDVWKARSIDVPFIIVSGTIGEDTAVDALKAGAHDFLVKGRLARLLPAIERAARETKERQARHIAQK